MGYKILAGILIGYFLGSIPFTQIIAKYLKGIDLREVGSKNVGGINTMHSVGLGWGLLGGALDVLKATAAISIAIWLGITPPNHIWAGVAAVAGHNWPIWLKFKGGKGIATIIGGSLRISPIETILGFITGVIVHKFTKNILVTTMIGFSTIVIFMVVFENPREAPWLVWSGVILMISADLPEIIDTLRRPNGLKDYFDRPKKVYDK